MFTEVAVGQLIQAGRVDPTAPVGTYLTDCPNRDVATKVTTTHHLLTHRRYRRHLRTGVPGTP
jgi:CubicO group peptidase (beta-lactamase class C family)